MVGMIAKHAGKSPSKAQLKRGKRYTFPAQKK